MLQPLFINTFQKGASENANIGNGTFLGIETYSKKGVARLTKDSVKTSGSVVVDLPIYFANHTEQDIFAQGDTGRVYRSIDGGVTWTDITNPAWALGAGKGKGLVFFDGVLYAFFGTSPSTALYYCVSPFGTGNWAAFSGATGLKGDQNFPFIFPSAYGFYFANGNKVGLLQEKVTGTAIDPTNSTTYNYSDSILTLPEIYEVTTLSFLPPTQLMIGTKSSGVGNDTQIADLIGWDTLSLNKFSPPLRLYSNAYLGESGIKQLINRNNTLYAVTGGNHAVFQTNGATFNQIAEMGLRTNYRTSTGEQATAPVFLNPRQSAIAIIGNKILTGVSTSTVNEAPSGSYALAPMGVWSIAFMEDNDMAIQCEFPISTGTIRSNDFIIGAVHPVYEGRILIGWKDGSNYGIDITEAKKYQNDINTVWIESAMMQVGTPLNPTPIRSVEFNFVRDLISGQSFSLYGRNGFDQPYTLMQTFDPAIDGSKNSYKNVKNSIGQCQYFQILVQMKTGSPNEAWSPELRNIIIQ